MMKKNKQLVPKRRFKEFENDGEWELYQLEEVVKITMGQSPSSINYTNDPEDYILVQGNSDIKNGKVVPRIWTTQITKKANKGDLILSVRAPVGDIGKTDFEVVLGRGVAAISGNEFIFQSLIKMKDDDYWSNLITGSTFESINSNDIRQAEMFIPSINEQNKIGLFLQKIDRLIKHQQLKIKKTKKIKDSYLSDMFPKKGGKYPKKRFEGFTDSWEYCALGDVVQITMGQSPSSANYTENPDDYILVQGNADMKNGKVVPRVWTTQITKQAEKGDLILSVRAPVGDIGKTGYDVVLGRGVAAVKGNDFIYQTLSRMKENGCWNNLITGSTFESINSNDIRDARIAVPSEEEQQKIGIFFDKLDKQIDLEKQKLEKLEQLKQAYLNELFV